MLTLLHTAAVHVDTFTALRDQIAPNAELTHLVHPELLAEAQDGITPELEQRMARAARARFDRDFDIKVTEKRLHERITGFLDEKARA